MKIVAKKFIPTRVPILIWLVVIPLVPFTVSCSKYAEKREDIIREHELFKFGASGKVIDVYRFQTGNKTANYQQHTVAVVERHYGKLPLKVAVGNHAPAKGQIWSLVYNSRANKVELGERVNSLLTDRTDSLPLDPVETWVKANAANLKVPIFLMGLIGPTIFLMSIIVGVITCFSTISLMVAVTEVVFCKNSDAVEMEIIPFGLVMIGIASIMFSFMSLLISAEPFIATVTELNSIFTLGFWFGFPLFIAGIAYLGFKK